MIKNGDPDKFPILATVILRAAIDAVIPQRS